MKNNIEPYLMLRVVLFYAFVNKFLYKVEISTLKVQIYYSMQKKIHWLLLENEKTFYLNIVCLYKIFISKNF